MGSVVAGSSVPTGGSVVLSLSGKMADGKDYSVAVRSEGINLFVSELGYDKWIYWSG